MSAPTSEDAVVVLLRTVLLCNKLFRSVVSFVYHLLCFPRRHQLRQFCKVLNLNDCVNCKVESCIFAHFNCRTTWSMHQSSVTYLTQSDLVNTVCLMIQATLGAVLSYCLLFTTYAKNMTRTHSFPQNRALPFIQRCCKCSKKRIWKTPA